MRTRWRGGILWSEYSVRGEDGASISLEVPGGTRDGVVQRAVEAPPPAPHARVVVLIEKGHTRGHAWAHRADGLLYGGSLGDGPAIENM